jgi:hypothetical protein
MNALNVLAKSAHGALAPGGMLLIHDFLTDDELTGPSIAALHLLLLAMDNPELASLTRNLVAQRLAEAGFRNVTHDVLIPGITRLVVGHKA